MQSPNIGILKDNGRFSYDSYWCDGCAHWHPPAGSGDPGRSVVGGTSPLEFGVLVLPSPPQKHSCILTRLQKYDPIFNIRVVVMKPVFNMEPKYRVTMLSIEEWTRGPGTPPAVKWLIWYTDGSRTAEGTGAGVYGQSANRSLNIPLGRHSTVFHAVVHAILACVQEIETQDRLEKHVSISSDSQEDLKALQASKTRPPLVRQCQQKLNDISARHAVGLYWVPGHAGLRGKLLQDISRIFI